MGNGFSNEIKEKGFWILFEKINKYSQNNSVKLFIWGNYFENFLWWNYFESFGVVGTDDLISKQKDSMYTEIS